MLCITMCSDEEWWQTSCGLMQVDGHQDSGRGVEVTQTSSSILVCQWFKTSACNAVPVVPLAAASLQPQCTQLRSCCYHIIGSYACYRSTALCRPLGVPSTGPSAARPDRCTSEVLTHTNTQHGHQLPSSCHPTPCHPPAGHTPLSAPARLHPAHTAARLMPVCDLPPAAGLSMKQCRL